jgi:16S rRNA C967 or C1407 C5-methylase (RsmB/RsmF family)
MGALPTLFFERLKQILPSDLIDVVLSSFQQEKDPVIRWNSLHPDKADFLQWLDHAQVSYKKIVWYPDAFVVPFEQREQLSRSVWVENGSIYFQNISSLFIPVVLQPEKQETIIDLCAAPGSKLSQIAMMTHDQADLSGIEPIRKRFYRMRSVLEQLGVQHVQLYLKDGRRWQAAYPADKVLVDAPCSSEGRFSAHNAKSVKYWSLRKIREMRRKQRGLLLNASRLLKPGGRLVYSTCTFAPEENEGVVNWFLKKTKGDFYLEPVDTRNLAHYPPLRAWGEITFDPDIRHCVRLLPNDVAEAFFVASLRKKS